MDKDTKRVKVEHKEKNVNPKDFVQDTLVREAKKRRWLWMLVFLLALGCIVLPSITGLFIVQEMSRDKYVAVIDESKTMYITPLKDADKSIEIINESAIWAAYSLLNRNPSGIDYPDLLEKIYGVQSKKKAEKELEAFKPNAKVSNEHWKAEIEKVEIVNSLEANVVVAKVTGRVIKTGVIGGVEERTVPDFLLSIKLVRNPQLLSAGRYPFVVHDYQLKFN